MFLQALGVTTIYFIYACGNTSILANIVVTVAIFGFRLALNFITLILALLSCFKITKNAVNDAKSVMTIIYINTANTITISILLILLTQDINAIIVVSCLSVILIPTNILVFTFIPKVTQ